MKRCFLGIPVKNENVLKRIIEIQRMFKPFERGLKFVPVNNFHFTLKFLGNIEQTKISEIIRELTSAFTEYTPFEINLRGIGVFPSKNYIRVLWIGVENAENLVELMKLIDQKLSSLGFPRENSYVPHLTIARVKFISAREHFVKLLRELEEEKIGKVSVKEIVLYESKLFPTGPVYIPLHRWEL